MLKQWIVNRLLEYLCNALVEDRFLTVKFTNKEMTQGKVYENGKELEPNLVREMASEARIMKKLGIYKRINESIKSHATQKMVNDSQKVEDMIFSKAMLYITDVAQKKVDNISRLTF